MPEITRAGQSARSDAPALGGGDAAGAVSSLVREEDVFLCLMVNRRHQLARVIDFRAGFSPMKRRLVVEHAQVCQVERLFTVVEREEVSAWVRMGFSREGSIPGFYKRCDGYVLGAAVDALMPSHQSGTRLASRVNSEPEFQLSRRTADAWSGRAAVRVAPARELELHRALTVARRDGRAITDFEPFSRDAERRHFMCTARGGFSTLVSVEIQACFDNAWLEVLTAPRTDKEARLLASALAQVGDLLGVQGTVSCFAISPLTETHLGSAFLGGGFRPTGNLNRHFRAASTRVDGVLWSRKLAQPRDP